MELQKKLIYSENQGKSGIYRITNKINKKFYIGSAIDLKKRLTLYFNNYKLKKSNMIISKSLLKYGHSNFSLDILEYCVPDKLLLREQYYLDLLNPTYNILKIAGSLLGYKHSIEVKEKMKGRKHSLETIDKMKNRKFSEETLNKMRERTHSVEVREKLKN